MAAKQITARISIGIEPIGKVTYETSEKSELGKRLARLTLDEIVGFVSIISETEDESWEVRFTDEDGDELIFTSVPGSDKICVEQDDKEPCVIKHTASNRTASMWTWMKQKGWY